VCALASDSVKLSASSNLCYHKHKVAQNVGCFILVHVIRIWPFELLYVPSMHWPGLVDSIHWCVTVVQLALMYCTPCNVKETRQIRYVYDDACHTSTCVQLSVLAFEITRHRAWQPQVKA